MRDVHDSGDNHAAERDGLADVRESLKRNYDRLTEGHKRVINRLVVDPHYAAVVSASQLAAEVNVSEATVTRAAQALGYSGFPDLQSRLRQHVMSALEEKMANIYRLGDTAGSTALQVMLDDADNLRSTVEDLSPELIEEATELLISARRVYVFGMRGSYGLAIMLGIGLRLLLPDARVVNAGDGALEDQLLGMAPEDVLIVISFRRTDRQAAVVSRYAHEVGASIIAITNSVWDSLTRVATLTLTARVGPLRPTLSYAAAASLVNALSTALSIKTLQTTPERLEEAERIWQYFDTFVEE